MWSRRAGKLCLGLILTLVLVAPASAQWDPWGYYTPWTYHYPYYYPYYYYPPYASYPPYPPVIYYTAPQTVSPRTCRSFNGDATRDDTRQPFYGTACLYPDGKWHIVP